MSLTDLFSVVSTFFFVSAGAFGVFRVLWQRFEKRMDRGDDESRQRDSEVIKKLDAIEMVHQSNRASDAGRMNVLELSQARLEGQTSTLIAIFGSGGHNQLNRIDVTTTEREHLP